MVRKIIEIKVTKKGADGTTNITYINALDSLQGTILSQYDDALEAGIEKAIFQKAEQSDQMESDSVYEVSPTFHDPTVVVVGLGDDITAAATVKARGIRRPFVKKLRTPATQKIYHHESGIVGFMEGKGRKKYKVIRFPIRLIKELGMDAVSEFYPEITDSLGFKLLNGKKSSAFIDGDLSYRETEPFNPCLDEKGFRLQCEKFKAHGNEFQKKLISVAFSVKKKYGRHKELVEDFAATGDITRFYEELEHTSWDMCMITSPFPQPLLVNGIMGRMYVYGSDASPEKKHIYEMWIPMGMLKEIKKRRYENAVPMEKVKEFLKQDRMSIGEHSFGKGIVESPPVQLVGDILYVSICKDMQEYGDLKAQIDDLGKKYLDRRMNNLRIFG